MSHGGLTRVFVYGSLKRGFRHHDVMGEARFVREVRTAPGYVLVRLGEYPALAPRDVRSKELSSEFGAEEPRSVAGELYEVTPEDLLRLDEFEDCPDLYQRGTVELDDGSDVVAYVISGVRAAALPVVPGGAWRLEDQ